MFHLVDLKINLSFLGYKQTELGKHPPAYGHTQSFHCSQST